MEKAATAVGSSREVASLQSDELELFNTTYTVPVAGTVTVGRRGRRGSGADGEEEAVEEALRLDMREEDTECKGVD